MNDEHHLLKPSVPDGIEVGRDILLPEGLSERLMMGSLERVFAEDDDLDAVAVHRSSGCAYVLREDFLDALSPDLRFVGGWGDADQLFLPGKEDLQPITLRCPVDGQCFQVFFVNPGEARLCPRHAGTRLEVVADA